MDTTTELKYCRARIHQTKKMKELIIIGGGQAGLAAAYYAQQNNVDYTLIEKASSAGDSWQKRWKSLTLFSPKKLSTLPGMKMKGDDQDAFP